MDVGKILLVAGIACLLQVTTAGPVAADGFEEPFIQKGDSDGIKPKNVDMASTSYFLRLVMNEAQALWNPCSLVDRVQEGVKRAPQKTKFRVLTDNYHNSPPASGDFTVTHRKVLDQALPAIREGISLYRTQFVLQETKNLTVFLDQNRDGIYANTSLRSYSHYYVRAANEEVTQILFIGIIKNKDLLTMGSETAAMQFLSLNGLIHHPRQYVEFSTVPAQEAQLILEKRQQMADLLSTQDTFWEDDVEYLTNIITVAFNGPEQEAEQAGILPKVAKNFVHRMQESSMVKLGDKYETVCLQRNLQKASDQSSMEAIALFAL